MYIVAFYSNILIFFFSPLLLSSEYLFLCLSLLFTLTKTCNLTPPISKHKSYPIATTTKTCYNNGKLTQNQTINGKPITQTQNQTQWRERFQRKTRYLHQRKTHKPKPKPSGERDLRGERVLRVERKEKRNLISDD